MTSPYQVQNPVAMIVFNRPDVTERVFQAVRAAQPAQLLVVGDGARAGRTGEMERVEAVRAIVARVDWPCRVQTDYSLVNLGCKGRLTSGISWLFSQVERCIILEDDCLPHPTFFRFCDEMLARFATDRRVFHISGVNFQGGHRVSDDSYYFSRICHVWGWASWADRWNTFYDPALTDWPTLRGDRLVDIAGGEQEAHFWRPVLDRVHAGQLDTWDYQWAFATMRNGGLAVTPQVNLFSNIGFGAGATHTTESSELANVPVQPMGFPLRHPPGVFHTRSLDRRFFERFWSNSLRHRLLRRLSRLRHSST